MVGGFAGGGGFAVVAAKKGVGYFRRWCAVPFEVGRKGSPSTRWGVFARGQLHGAKAPHFVEGQRFVRLYKELARPWRVEAHFNCLVLKSDKVILFSLHTSSTKLT